MLFLQRPSPNKNKLRSLETWKPYSPMRFKNSTINTDVTSSKESTDSKLKARVENAGMFFGKLRSTIPDKWERLERRDQGLLSWPAAVGTSWPVVCRLARRGWGENQCAHRSPTLSDVTLVAWDIYTSLKNWLTLHIRALLSPQGVSLPTHTGQKGLWPGLLVMFWII